MDRPPPVSAARAPLLENVEDIYPTTPLQAGMIFHAVADPGSDVHAGQVVLDLDGDLDLEALRKAWAALTARHAALRTAFAWDGLDAPMQVVRAQVTTPWTVLDWRDRGGAERDAAFDAWRAADAARVFDLTKAPLSRIAVFRFARTRHRLVWTSHHAIADGWSIGLALQELLARLHGEEPAGPPPRYRDHIAYLKQRDFRADEGFWRTFLAGFTERTSIAPARVGDPGAATRRRRHDVMLNPDRTAVLSRAATTARVTLNALFKAAWALTLSRYAARDDIVFGATASGRPDAVPGVEGMVGLFITTTPRRVTFRDGETGRALLARVQADAAAARAHDQLPLAKIQAQSDMTPGEALFDTLYVFGNYPPPDANADDPLTLSGFEITVASNFPLALLVDPTSDGGLRLTAVVDPALYPEAMARRLLRTVVAAAEALAADLDAEVVSLDAAPPEETARLEALGHGGPGPAAPQDVLAAVAAVARRTPDAPALIDRRTRLTYRAMTGRVAVIAARLARAGVAPGAIVAVNLERGPEAICAMLGVLAADCAYVPLDPAFPAARRIQAAEDSGAAAVITTQRRAGEIPAAIEIILDDGAPPQSDADITPPDAPTDRPAYLLYTSGSTGAPKGVVVTRANLAYSTAARAAFYDAPPKRFLLASSLAFDSSVAGVFWTLTRGGALIAPEPRLEQDVDQLAQRIETLRATHLLCLPSLFEILTENPRQAALSSLEGVIVAGEAVRPRALALRRSRLPDARLYNEYGPTEATVWCVAADITDAAEDAPPPIGRPIPGARVRLVDHRGRTAPLDAPGVLHVAGPGVAPGYHGRAAETAARFASDPADAAVRAYDTGDVARWRPDDGVLDFLGRRDAQVKVRGQRVEVAEVEAALAGLDGVIDAAVVAVHDDVGVRLAAFVVGAEAQGDALRDALSHRLPGAMVPSTITMLDALPALPNGKRDRAALQMRARAATTTPAAEYVAPRTAFERDLAEIWAAALGRDRIGITDDFFARGGDSLASIRIVSRARKRGLTIKATDILELGTIAALAANQDTARKAADGPPLVMVHGGARMAGLIQDAMGDAFSVHPLSDHWDAGRLAPDATIESMAEAYLDELRAAAPHGPYVLGGYSIGGPVALEMARRLTARGAAVSAVFLVDPMDDLNHLAGADGVQTAGTGGGAPALDPFVGAADMVRRAAPDGLLARLRRRARRAYRVLVRDPLRIARAAAANRGGLAPPLDTVHAYTTHVYTRAMRRHRLRPYDGRLIVLRSMADRTDAADHLWARLASGPYAEERLDCSHLELRRDPAVVKSWALRLAARLQEG